MTILEKAQVWIGHLQWRIQAWIRAIGEEPKVRSSGHRHRRSRRWWTRRRVYEKYGGLCFYCKTPVSLKEGTMDHIIPRALGGTGHLKNLAWCCVECNQKKDTLIEETPDPVALLAHRFIRQDEIAVKDEIPKKDHDSAGRHAGKRRV